MTFLLTLWKPIAAVVGVALLAITVIAWKHNYDEGKREEGRAEIQAKWDQDRAARIKATTDMTLLWDAKRQEAEKAITERDNERSKRTEVAASAARTLPVAVARVVVPRQSIGVLNDAIDASNSTTAAGPSREATKAAPAAASGADSTLGLLTEWGVLCIAAYDDARGMVADWQKFYADLRATQPKVEP